MRVVVDINVLLDGMLEREPHAPAAVKLLSHIERGTIAGHLCASSVDTLYYLLCREREHQTAQEILEAILTLHDIVPVDGDVIHSAFHLGWSDLEDAIIHQAARKAGIHIIVTHDQSFGSGSVITVSAAEAIALASSSQR